MAAYLFHLQEHCARLTISKLSECQAPLTAPRATVTLDPIILIDVNKPGSVMTFPIMSSGPPRRATTQLSDARWMESPRAKAACWKSVCPAGMSPP